MNKKPDNNDAGQPPLAMLEKRRIEAAILKNVYDVLVERHSVDEARDVISQSVIRSAIAQGKEFSEQLDHDPDLEDFAALSDLWEMGGALKKKILKRGPGQLDYDMVHCGYADMYREMGLADIGFLLSCNRDATFCLGYNEKMKLTRTQTIMEGASHCDFRYRLEVDKSDD